MLYCEIIDKYDQNGSPKKYFSLSDSAKLSFLLLLCLKSRFKSNIPFESEKEIKRQLGINRLELKPLIDVGFISIVNNPEVQGSCTEILQKAPENPTLEGEGDLDTEREGEREGKIPPPLVKKTAEEIHQLRLRERGFGKFCTKCGSSNSSGGKMIWRKQLPFCSTAHFEAWSKEQTSENKK